MTVLGLAGTALAFAGSRAEEVERWLRTLSRYGATGATLRAVGVDEASGAGARSCRIGASDRCEDEEDTLASVITCAERFAAQRGVPVIGTAELVFAVMQVYGSVLDEALALRGTDRAEVIDCLDRAFRLASV